MLLVILYYAILSICIIVIGHVLWNRFCESVITSKPRYTSYKKYQDILHELQSPDVTAAPQHAGFISEEEKRAMVEELQALISQ